MLPDHCRDGVTFLFWNSSFQQPAVHGVAGMPGARPVTNFESDLELGFRVLPKPVLLAGGLAPSGFYQGAALSFCKESSFCNRRGRLNV